jgi:hypothetical protein
MTGRRAGCGNAMASPDATLPWTAPLCAALLCAAFALGGCANGDFGRVKPGLVSDDIHSWVGTTAALGNGAPISSFPLTDDERALRDLAYPLIEPPYDRQRWFSVLNEYGIGRIFHHDWSRFDEQLYTRVLMREPLRSETARYARLGDDIRNDRTRVPAFFLLAGRVLEMDRRREASLDAVSNLTAHEIHNALGRNAENALVISWVQWSLTARTVSYRVALERLAIGEPMAAATDIERSLTALQNLIANYRVLPGPDFAPGPGVITLPPYEGPLLGRNGLPVRAPVVGRARPAAAPVTPVRYDPEADPTGNPIY